MNEVKEFEMIFKCTVLQSVLFPRAINWNVEPVAGLIRCKSCKHWDGYYCHNKCWGDGYGNYTPPIKTEDGFCDWAERRDDDEGCGDGADSAGL